MNVWSGLDATDKWLQNHRVLVFALSGLAFALSCAAWAGFVRLPAIVRIPAQFAWLLPALRYGVWEAVVTPQLEARRSSIQQDSTP